MLAYLLIIVVAFGAVSFALTQLVGEYLFSQRITEDARTADALSMEMADLLSACDAVGLYEAAKAASDENGQRVLVLDAGGVVQADTLSELNGTRFAVPEVREVLMGSDSAYGYYSQTGDNAAQYLMALIGRRDATGVFTSAIRRSDDTIGVLVYISRAQQIYESLRQIELRIMIWIVLVALAVMVMSSFVLRTITNPLSELNEGIQLMTRGDFSARVKVSGKNEFAQLANAFNVMTERLEKLDQARNTFVSNASHELRTPLTSIKLVIENVMAAGNAMPEELRNEFLDDAEKEIDRLARIIEDLLTLVNIDSEGMQLKLDAVNLHDMLQLQIQRLMPIARERGIEMQFTASDLCETMADNSKLSQVFYNVIENATKYTPRGGRVRVELTRSGKKALVKISDTGIGIPEADIPHIFDRFYRVDKARSRETGGTGLGLSIVKQIVNLHNGDITVTSRENEGSTFTISLPLNAKNG